MSLRILAEYPRPGDLVAAVRALRASDGDLVVIEAYTPYPVHGLDEALGRGASRLPLAVFVAGLGGAGAAYSLQWLLNAYLYPLDVGGRPPHFPFAFVPITFEMGVLAAALTSFFGVLALGRLLRLWQPIFTVDGIASTTRDGFWLEVAVPEARGQAGADDAIAELRRLGAARVSRLGHAHAGGELQGGER